MLSTSSLAKVPEILWFQVFKYCEISDFVQLQKVCRRLTEHATHYTEIYERECLRIFTSGLELYEYAICTAL